MPGFRVIRSQAVPIVAVSYLQDVTAVTGRTIWYHLVPATWASNWASTKELIRSIDASPFEERSSLERPHGFESLRLDPPARSEVFVCKTFANAERFSICR